MSKRVVLIQHSHEPFDDYASDTLSALGFTLDWRRPFDGDTLEEPDETVAATVIYGGKDPADPKDWHTDRFPFIAEETRWVERCMAKGIPTVGFCLGGGIISHALGAAVGPIEGGMQEFGFYEIKATEAGREILPESIVMPAKHYHGFGLPTGAIHLAYSDLYPNQAYRYGDRTFAFQFHPEVSEPFFRRWQELPNAPWDRPGVQSRAEQDRIAAEHRPAQRAWLDGFLETLMQDSSTLGSAA